MTHHLPTAPASLTVPSTKTWLLLAGLLTTLLVAERQAPRPASRAGRPAATATRVAMTHPPKATFTAAL